MLKEQLHEFMETGETAPPDYWPELRKEVEKYPYFQILLFFYLKSLYIHDTQSFDGELARLSPFVADRAKLFYTIFDKEYAQFFRKTGKKNLPIDRTNLLIDAFFETKSLPDADHESHWEQNVFNAGIVSVDYFSYLEKSGAAATSGHQPPAEPAEAEISRGLSIIDAFLEKSSTEGGELKVQLRNEGKTTAPPTGNDDLEDSTFFTETLSRIYIKQKKYTQAYKIIKELSLKYPEKNIYFADQIRFLEKLIINTSNNK